MGQSSGNYSSYANWSVVNLTKDSTGYSMMFTMDSASDAGARLEFNMGGSSADVHLAKVDFHEVTLGNQPPVARDTAVTVAEGGSTTVTLNAKDTDGTIANYAVPAQPSHGTASVSGNVLTYVPTAGFHGLDTVQWIATDNGGASDTAKVVVTVTQVTLQAQSIGFSSRLAATYSNAPAALTGSATSGLAVSYAVSDTSIAKASGTSLAIRAAGTAYITATQAGNGSYLAASPVVCTLTVVPKAVSVFADSVTKVYGSTDPVLSYTDTGLAAGDTLTGGLARVSGSAVGSYAIGQGTLAADSNYALSFTGSHLTITPATLTIKAKDDTIAYGAAYPTFGAIVSGLVNGDGVAVVTGLRMAVDSSSGTDSIVPSGASAANYSIAYVDGVLTVDAASTGIGSTVRVPTSGLLDARISQLFAKPAQGSGLGSLGTGVQDCQDNSCQALDVILPQPGSIDLAIYDNLGTEVIAWNTQVSASDLQFLPGTADGRHVAHLAWNLRSASGRAVPEGVYLWMVKVTLADGSTLEDVYKLGVRK
jgi:hypothetical protein